MAFRVTISGDRPSENPLRRFQWTRAAAAWADEVGPLVRSAMRDRAPVAKGPGGGRLRDSIRYERSTSGGRVELRWGSGVPYVPYVVEGTPPHLIRARAARALRWQSQGGETRFARWVNHPGTRPNPFPRRAMEPLLPVIQAKFREVVEAQFRA